MRRVERGCCVKSQKATLPVADHEQHSYPAEPRPIESRATLDRRGPDGGHYAEQTDGRHAADPSGGPANVAKVTMPQLGESVAEGTIGKWLKQPGDHVAKYEPLVEVVTDKVNAEVPSPFEGILREILVEEGATVPNNAEIAVIETADDGAARGAGATDPRPPSRPPAAPAAAAPTAAAPQPRARRRPPPVLPAATPRPRPSPPRRHRPRPPDRRRPQPQPARRSPRPRPPRPRRPAPRTADPDARMTPAVRRLLREHDLSPPRSPAPAVVAGSPARTSSRCVESIRTGTPAPAAGRGGPDGRHGGSAQPAAGPGRQPRRTAPRPPQPAGPGRTGGRRSRSPTGADEVLLPMTQMRKGIAAQMTRALAVPHAYVQMEVDATAPRARSARRPSATTRRARGSRSATSRSSSRPPSRRSSATRRSTPTGPTNGARWPSAGSTSASPSPSTTACSSRSSTTSTSSRSAASTGPSPTSPPAPAPASSASTTPAAARSPSTTPAGSART